jgi:hypothetical protein
VVFNQRQIKATGIQLYMLDAWGINFPFKLFTYFEKKFDAHKRLAAFGALTLLLILLQK